MNKQDFLRILNSRLSALPQEERDRLLEFYAELIDDKIEHGEDELQAVKNLGTIDKIVQEALDDTVDAAINPQQNSERKRGSFGARIAVVVCTSPVWLPLYISAWMVIVSLYVTALACGLGGVLYLLLSFSLFGQSAVVCFFQVGICLFLVGAGIFIFIGTILITKYFCVFTRFLWRGIRYSFSDRKGENL